MAPVQGRDAADDQPGALLRLHHPHHRRPQPVHAGVHRVLRRRRLAAGGRALLLDLPVQERVRVLQHGLRVREGLAALRDQHGHHAVQHPRQPPLRLLPGLLTMSVGTQQNAPPALTAGAAAPLPTVREQGPWYRSRPDASWIVKGFFILLLIALAILFLYPFEWLAAAAFKPRGETFDNAFLPQTWAW